MTSDITFLTSSARAQPDSTAVDSVAAKIVPINSNVSQRLAQDSQQASNTQADNAQASDTNIVRATQQLNDFIRQIGRNLEFTVDESSGKVIITVRESESGKIIRQIPPQELLSIASLINKNFLSHSIPTGILLADQS